MKVRKESVNNGATKSHKRFLFYITIGEAQKRIFSVLLYSRRRRKEGRNDDKKETCTQREKIRNKEKKKDDEINGQCVCVSVHAKLLLIPQR